MDATTKLLLEVILLLGGLAFIAFLVWIRRNYAMRRKHDVQETIRAALAQGQTLTPETVQAISRTADDGRGDLRAGLILVSLGLGIIVFALFYLVSGPGASPGEGDWRIAQWAGFPILLGTAYLILYFTRPRGDG